ncbi:MAG: hypothetical protein HMLIMOIP_002629 [Candidatus Nitrosomirales archaeon]|jgi:hypothetical protein
MIEDEELLGAVLPCHCDEVISRLEKYLEKQIASMKRQADEIMAFLETGTESNVVTRMISDLDTILTKIKDLKHPDFQFDGDPRQNPLENFLHFHRNFSKTYDSLVTEFLSIQDRLFNLINQKLNDYLDNERRK